MIYGNGMLDFLQMVLHIDQALGVWVQQYGAGVYLALFVIVFAETGLVIAPFLPGDSLLFVGGAFGATGALDPLWLGGLLMMAAAAGNTVNYFIGRAIGPRVFSQNARLLDRAALLRARLFCRRHGGKAIVMSRFVPVVRTFAPFVAGVGRMNLLRFQLFNVGGAALWVGGLVAAGYFFGNIPLVRDHLNTIVLAGLAAAMVPVTGAALFRLARARRLRD